MTPGKPTHGGARPGAGRKPSTGTGKLLRLAPALIERLRKTVSGKITQTRIWGAVLLIEELRTIANGTLPDGEKLAKIRERMNATSPRTGRKATT